MSKHLQALLSEGKLKRHQTNAKEVSALLEGVERDIQDASIQELSAERRFMIAYQGALKLCTIALYVSRYRASTGHGHHWITIDSLTDTMGKDQNERASYFNMCRSKRNTTDYTGNSMIDTEEADELLAELKAFRNDLTKWLKPHNL